MSVMTDPAAIRAYATAGRAVVTLKSLASGKHFTLRFKSVEDTPSKFFVSVLTGPEQFSYLGLFDGQQFRTTRRSCAGLDAPSARAAQFFCDRVLRDEHLPPTLEVRHEGRCGRCSRPLTHPESLALGLGPDCLTRV